MLVAVKREEILKAAELAKKELHTHFIIEGDPYNEPSKYQPIKITGAEGMTDEQFHVAVKQLLSEALRRL